MRATVLIDNIAEGDLIKEWGLSFYIEYRGKNYLLDTGASNKYLENAEKLGIDVGLVDYGVLSHAHYDHANGIRGFFKKNEKACFYLREGSKENCYHKKSFFRRYIGIKRGTLKKYAGRILFVQGKYKLNEGVWLLPHTTPGLDKIGLQNSMFIKEDGKWKPDDYRHEQSLVFETEEGLVIFNSCSHGGADTIINETAKAFPGEKIAAIIGGFHIYNKSEEYIKKFAGRIKQTGITGVYTGHCSGGRGYKILNEELDNTVIQLHTGLVIKIGE